jgi:hypothetical protein
MPIRITQIHRISGRIHIPVGPHPWLGRVPPVALGEQAELGVMVAGMEVDQPGLRVEALADPGLVLGLRFSGILACGAAV